MHAWLVASAAAAVVLLALGGVVYRISTDRGELVIHCHDEAVEVTIKRNGKTVVEGLEVSHGQEKTTVRSGQVHQIDLLLSLFAEIVIPPAVRSEIGTSFVPPSWMIEQHLTQPIGALVGFGFHIMPQLRERVLADAGEIP